MLVPWCCTWRLKNMHSPRLTSTKPNTTRRRNKILSSADRLTGLGNGEIAAGPWQYHCISQTRLISSVFNNSSLEMMIWLNLSWWISFKRSWQQAERDNEKNGSDVQKGEMILDDIWLNWRSPLAYEYSSTLNYTLNLEHKQAEVSTVQFLPQIKKTEFWSNFPS